MRKTIKKVLLSLTIILVIIGASLIVVFYPKDEKKIDTINLIEYADFECPACAAFQPQLKNAVKFGLEEGIEVNIDFKHFPLKGVHPRAEAAHRASEAAAIQGKFWEMHDILYENQAEWSSISTLNLAEAQKVIEQYAEQLELNIEKYRLDLNSSEVSIAIDNDASEAKQDDINSVPTIFVVNNLGEPNEEKVRIKTPIGNTDEYSSEFYEQIKLAAGIEE